MHVLQYASTSVQHIEARETALNRHIFAQPLIKQSVAADAQMCCTPVPRFNVKTSSVSANTTSFVCKRPIFIKYQFSTHVHSIGEYLIIHTEYIWFEFAATVLEF